MELLDLIKESGVVRVHPDKLKPNTWNPNQMDEKTWNALGQSIRRYGIHLQPIVVRERGDKYQIIDGQHRWKWACKMGLDEVSIVVTDAADADAKKLTQILNRTRGTDDPAKLKELLDSLLVDLSPEEVIDGMLPSNTKELDELLAELEEEIDEEYGTGAGGDEDEDELNEVLDNVGKVESRVKLGEIWQLGRHKIACGDSTVEANVRALLGDHFGNVGMVWSDPPFGINLHTSYKGGKSRSRVNYAPVIGDEDLTTVTKCFSVCEKFKAVSIWWGANHYCHLLKPSPCWIVWDKKEEGDFEVTFADCEIAWSNAEQQARIFKHLWRGFRRDSEQGETRTHPTQKPIALCEWAFDKYGKSDDVIFDPFLGSAPSIIAAQKMEGDRTVYGFELSPDYCEVIIKRYEQYNGDVAKKIGTLPGY